LGIRPYRIVWIDSPSASVHSHRRGVRHAEVARDLRPVALVLIVEHRLHFGRMWRRRGHQCGDPRRIHRHGRLLDRFLHRQRDAIHRDAHAARLGRHRVLVDQHLLDPRLRAPVQRPDLVTDALEARSRVRQPRQLAPGRLRLA
jgi:hypothetical protein